MTPALIVCGIVAFVAGWNYFLYRLSGRPFWNPLWMAFTLTAVALFEATAGAMGYVVPHNFIIEHPAKSVGHVVWPEIQVGLAMAVLSSFFWWQGLKRMRPLSSRRSSACRKSGGQRLRRPVS